MDDDEEEEPVLPLVDSEEDWERALCTIEQLFSSRNRQLDMTEVRDRSIVTS